MVRTPTNNFKTNKTKQMSNFKKVVFAKSDFNNIGNMLSEPTINITEKQKSILTTGTLWVPIFTDPVTNERHFSMVREVIGEPTKSKHKTPSKENYNFEVKVRTVVESKVPIKIRKGTISGMLTLGNTKLDSKSEGKNGVKRKAYNEFERLVSLAIRS
jgi:hypothetical protein